MLVKHFVTIIASFQELLNTNALRFRNSVKVNIAGFPCKFRLWQTFVFMSPVSMHHHCLDQVRRPPLNCWKQPGFSVSLEQSMSMDILGTEDHLLLNTMQRRMMGRGQGLRNNQIVSSSIRKHLESTLPQAERSSSHSRSNLEHGIVNS